VASAADANGAAAAGVVRLYEDRWSAESVPDNLKELWVPSPQVLATTPPKASLSYPAEGAPRLPGLDLTMLPPAESSPPVRPASDTTTELWTASTAVPDSPLVLVSQSPAGSALSSLVLPPNGAPGQPPLKEPSADPGFMAARASLLKFRARGTTPREIKSRYRLIDEPALVGGGAAGGVAGASQSPTPASPAKGGSGAEVRSTGPGGDSAGTLLLKLAKGEVSTKEANGAAQGLALLDMLRTTGSAHGGCAGVGDVDLAAQTEQKQEKPLTKGWWNEQAQRAKQESRGAGQAAEDKERKGDWEGWGKPDAEDEWPSYAGALLDGAQEAQKHSDGLWYVQVKGKWIKASARYKKASKRQSEASW